LPFVRAGYVAAEWAEINPAPGKFDFSVLERELARYESLGKRATIMVRGGAKPGFLFEEVPYHPQALSKQVNDKRGTLQYWHPSYRAHHQAMLQAFSDFLKTTEYRDSVFSVRQTLNAVGTEHAGIKKRDRDPGQWYTPVGVEFVPYSKDRNADYKKWVSQAYYDLFAPDFLVLVRSVLLTSESADLPKQVLQAIEDGRVGLLHTSSQPEPISRSTEKKYLVHRRYGRNGNTPIYAEPFSSSTKGSRGEQPPAQWNYWRILSDLDAGVSYLAVYGKDLEAYRQPEYADAFLFANRYAGYQTARRAASSPGAWIAFREGGRFLQGDYSFLMSRLDGDANEALTAVGPDWQRFGAWARRIPAGGRMRLRLEQNIAASLADQSLVLRVTYFDSFSPSFDVSLGNGTVENFKGGANGIWKTVQMPVAPTESWKDSTVDITISADTDVTLHMVELVRKQVLAAESE
jgi:hypothetical protein